jgi:hypothetical protein
MTIFRSATLKASLVTVRKAIKSLPKLDTAESIKARAKNLNYKQLRKIAQLTSTIESRTGKIIEQEVVHDSLKPRIDLEAQIEAIKKLNSGNINNDLKNVIDSNESLRAQLSR